jgi:hypothetical protein
LKAFSDKHGITFPLLSDQGSAVITAWGLLNREATGKTAGIPYPGTYVINRSGTILSRSFEQAYQERETAAAILEGLEAGASTVSSAPSGADVIARNLRARVSATDTVVAPGHKVTLLLDITPGAGVHVYAPGQTGYIPVSLRLTESDDYKIAPADYPASRSFVFAPLKETVQVYDRPFRISQAITLALTPSMRQRATARETFAVTGTLEYQACDDKVCFRPDSVPLQWTFTLTPIER